MLRTLPLALLALLVALPAHAQQGFTLNGYGELHYNDPVNTNDGENPAGELDFHRFIISPGYNFNDWISFRSELELEHTLIEVEDEGEAEGGEVALEQAFVELRRSRKFGVRAGLILVPSGIINPVHEPPTFNGVERPNVDDVLIPTTWRENGIGVFGQFRNGLSYQAYVMAGLTADEISGHAGIEDAPQDGFESSVDNVAFTGRLDYQATLNLSVGTSIYYSSLTSNDQFGDALEGVRFTLLEGHAQYEWKGLEARGLLVFSTISNVERLNALFGNNAGETQLGGYVELGYDVLRALTSQSAQQVVVFGRYEPYDTQASMGDGELSDDDANARREYTVGVTYRPHPQVAFKADYQWLYNEEVQNVRQFNLGVGYNF